MAKNIKVNIYRQIALTFVASSVILIVVILFISLARATITIVPEAEDVNIEFIETINEEQSFASAVAGKILQTSVSLTKDFEASSSQVGSTDDRSTGMVVLYNETGNDMTLVATTRLLSSNNILFRIKSRVVISANSELEAEVYADEVGMQGDISPDTFFIPGLGEDFRGKVYAKSSQAMSGGSGRVYTVTQEDLDKAQENLKKIVSKQALDKLGGYLKTGEQFLPEATHVDIQEIEFNVEVGDKVGQFKGEIKAQVQGLVAERIEILKLARENLYLSVSPERDLLSVDESTLVYTLEKYDKVERSAQLKVAIKGKSILRQSSNLLDKEVLMGKTRQQVKDYLLSQNGVKEVKIDFSPIWVWKVPRLGDHIEIIVQE